MNSLKRWFENFKFKEKWGDLVTAISPILFSILFGFTQLRKYVGIWWFIFIIIALAILSVFRK